MLSKKNVQSQLTKEKTIIDRFGSIHGFHVFPGVAVEMLVITRGLVDRTGVRPSLENAGIFTGEGKMVWKSG